MFRNIRAGGNNLVRATEGPATTARATEKCQARANSPIP